MTDSDFNIGDFVSVKDSKVGRYLLYCGVSIQSGNGHSSRCLAHADAFLDAKFKVYFQGDLERLDIKTSREGSLMSVTDIIIIFSIKIINCTIKPQKIITHRSYIYWNSIFDH